MSLLHSLPAVMLAVSFTRADAETPGPAIRSLAAAYPAVYAGTAGGGLLRSGDGGITWVPVPEAACAGGVVSDVALGEDEKSVFVSCGDFKVLAFDGTRWTTIAPAISNDPAENPVDPRPARPRLHDDPLNDEKPTYLTGQSFFAYDAYIAYSWIRTGSAIATCAPYEFGPFSLLPPRLLAPSSEFSPWAIWTRPQQLPLTQVTTEVFRSLARQHCTTGNQESIGTIADDGLVALSRERGRPERLIAGGHVGAWVSTDEGRSWTLGLTGAVAAVAVDRTAPGRYAVAGNRLRWTADAGVTWIDLPDAPSDATALEFDEVEPTLLWIGRENGSLSSIRLLGPSASPAGRPTIISVKEESGALTVRFSARADDTARVRVERRPYGVGDFTPIGTVTLFDSLGPQPEGQPRAGTLRDTDAPTDVSLGYRVVAISSAGFPSPSDEKFAVLPTTEPLPPDGLTSEPDGTTFRLRWNDNSGREQGYLVEFQAQDGTFRPWAVVPANTTSYLIDASPLSSGFYRVGSFNARGHLEPTPPNVAGGTPPAAPAIDGYGGVNANFLSVTTRGPYIDGGVLERSIDDGSFAPIAAIPRGFSFGYSDGALSPDHDVVYRARYSNLAGPGPYSASLSLGTFNSEPDLVPNFRASYVSGAASQLGVLSASWGDVKREDYFQLRGVWAMTNIGSLGDLPLQAPRNATSLSVPAFLDGDHVLWVSAINTAGYADSPGFRLRAFAIWAETIAPTAYFNGAVLHLTPVIVQASGLNGAFYTTATSSVGTGRIRILDMGSDLLLTSGRLNLAGSFSDVVGEFRKDYTGLPPASFAGAMISYVPSGGGLNQIRVTTPVAVGDRVGRPGVVFNSVPIRRLPDSAVVLTGLRQDASFRSNIALVHPGLTDDPLVLRLTAVDGVTGRSIVLPDVTLERAEWKQIPSALATAGFQSPSQGWVLVERMEGSSRFYAYAVVNEVTTSDGGFVVPAVAVRPDDLSGMVVPLVLETAEHETEISLANSGTSPLDLTLEYRESIPSGGTFLSGVTVSAGRQVFLPGFVDGLRQNGAPLGVRGAQGRYGNLRIRRTDGRALAGLTASARLATRDGRFGTFVAGLPEGNGTEGVLVDGSTSELDGTTVVSHIPATAAETADAFVLNAGTDPVSLCVSLRDVYLKTVSPCTAEQARTLGPGALLRFEQPLGTTGLEIGALVVERLSGTGPLYAFGLLTDIVTRDPGFWEGSALEP